MKLSFIIPAYNEEKYIGPCLESVFQETKSKTYDVEVIVVNNASTDRTREVAKTFPGVTVVNEPKKGLTQARHAGFLASSGDLIANVDADTKIPKGWLDKVFYEFENNLELVALSGPYIYHDLSHVTRFAVRIYYHFGQLIHLVNHRILKKGAVLQGGNFILRRSALEKIGGYNVDFDFYGEDTDIARRIQAVGRVKFMMGLPMYTSGRRLRGEGIAMMAIRYPMNYVWTIIFKKPFTKKFKDIRE